MTPHDSEIGVPREHQERAMLFQEALGKRIPELAELYSPEQILYATFDPNQEYINDARDEIKELRREGTFSYGELERGIESAREKMKIETTTEVLLIASNTKSLAKLRKEVREIAKGYAGVLLKSMRVETDESGSLSSKNPTPYNQTVIYEFYGA
jgi:hypothetical protein